MTINKIAKIIKEIKIAQNSWTTADWTHENGSEEDPNYPNGFIPIYCYGDDPKHCEICEAAESDARAAADLGDDAIQEILRGNMTEARKALLEACRLENRYGDDPVWSVPMRLFNKLIREFRSRNG